MPESVQAVLRGPGQPLDPAVRAGMEGRLGWDLSAVRVHSDAAAGRSAAETGALAYTVGHHVAFGENRYRPQTADGQRLLAHELTHVVQQRGGPLPASGAVRLGDPDDGHEQEAEAAAGAAVRPVADERPGTVRRRPSPEATQEVPAQGTPMVRLDCGAMVIEFATEAGSESYPLTSCRMQPGRYTATVQVTGHDLALDFGDQAAGDVFAFSYRIGPGQRDPSRLFTRNGTRVTVVVNDFGAGSAPRHGAQPLTSVLAPGATYALAFTPGLVTRGGAGLASELLTGEALVSEGAAGTAEALLTAQGLTSAGTVVAEGATIAESLTAAGEAILVVEAAGGAEAELAVPVAGWIVGAIVLLTAGGLLLAGYLLSSQKEAPTAQPGSKQRPEKGRQTSPEGNVDVFPDTETGEKRRRRPRQCRDAWVPPAGGNPIHDEFARYVAERYGNPSYATVNYWLQAGDLAVDFDHHNPDLGVNEFFEVKTRHEILMRDWARSHPYVLAGLLAQAERQAEILARCAAPGWRLIWFFDDEQVADAARDVLAPFVHEVRGVRWRRQLPEHR